MLMPFGKYKGKSLSDIPADYLWWVLDNTDPGPSLRWDIEQCLAKRFEFRWRVPGRAAGRPSAGVDAAAIRRDIETAYRQTVQQALKTAYRQMALCHHPDRGGSNQAMSAINNLYERFVEILSGCERPS